MTKLPIPVYGTAVLILPATVLSMTPPDSAYLRVLFALCAQNRPADSVEALAKALALPPETAKNAIAYWTESGVLTYAENVPVQVTSSTDASEEPADEVVQPPKKPLREALPKYSEEELAEIYKSNVALRPTLDACQNEIGKIFSTHEAAKMAALYECYGLDEAYLIMLCALCKRRGKESVSYVVKTALALYDDGIRTSEALDAHIKKEDARHEIGTKLRKLFGLGEREEGRTEKAHFDRWTVTWQFSYEMIRAAFDIATANTGKAPLSYINKILSDWNENGIRTIEAVEAAQAEYAKQKPQQTKNGESSSGDGGTSSYSLDEFVDLAMKRSF